MAYAYHIYEIDDESDIIRVEHIFYGRTKADCQVEHDAHSATCPSLAAAVNDDRIEEEWESLDENELPRPNEDDEEEDD